MVGGPDAFVTGNYAGTPLSDVLPVDLDNRGGGSGIDVGSYTPKLTDAGRVAPVLGPLRALIGEDFPEMPGANVVGDARGNALAAWSEGGGAGENPSVAYSRYDALAQSWSAPGKLTSLPTTADGYSGVDLLIGSNGVVGAVLTNYDGPNGSWTGQRFNAFH